MAENRNIRRTLQPGPENITDFTIKLDIFTWHVHSDVFAKQSGFFKRICEGDDWRESEERSVTLHDDNPMAFARFIQYMYYGEYWYEGDERPWRHSSWGTIIEILETGIGSVSDQKELQKYIQPLRRYSECDLGVYALADKYDCPRLAEYALKELVGEIDSDHKILEEVWSNHYLERTNGDKQLKDTLAQCIAICFDSLIKTESWVGCNGIGEWVRNDWELNLSVMKYLRDGFTDNWFSQMTWAGY